MPPNDARILALVPQDWLEELRKRAVAGERSLAGEVRLAIRSHLGLDEKADEDEALEKAA